MAAAAAERGSCNEVRKARAWLANWPDGLDDIRVGAAEAVLAELELVGRLCPAAEAPPAALAPVTPIDCISICSAWSAPELFEIADVCTTPPPVEPRRPPRCGVGEARFAQLGSKFRAGAAKRPGRRRKNF